MGTRKQKVRRTRGVNGVTTFVDGNSNGRPLPLMLKIVDWIDFDFDFVDVI